jgi:hypothetical protein
MEVPLYLDDILQFLILYRKTSKKWYEGKPHVEEH